MRKQRLKEVKKLLKSHHQYLVEFRFKPKGSDSRAFTAVIGHGEQKLHLSQQSDKAVITSHGGHQGLPLLCLRLAECSNCRSRLWGKCQEAPTTLASGLTCVLQSSFSSNKAPIIIRIQLLCLFLNLFTEFCTLPIESTGLDSKRIRMISLLLLFTLNLYSC